MLVEAGGYEFSEASQDFCRGDVIGDRYPFRFHEARLRQFGGTSGLWSGWVFPFEPSDFATELFHRAMRVAPEWSGRMLKRMGKEYQCCALIQSELEQFPLPENRVELDQRADALGVPIARLYWNKAQTERKTALTATRLLGEAMIEHDIGRLRMRNYLLDGTAWPQDDQGVGCHHMGDPDPVRSFVPSLRLLSKLRALGVGLEARLLAMTLNAIRPQEEVAARAQFDRRCHGRRDA